MRLTSIVHILSPETDNCPSCISGRERMTVENISWSISTKECCRPRQGLNPGPPGLQSDDASNWATEAGYAQESVTKEWRNERTSQKQYAPHFFKVVGIIIIIIIIIIPVYVSKNCWMKSSVQCRPWSDNTFCDILTESTQFTQA